MFNLLYLNIPLYTVIVNNYWIKFSVIPRIIKVEVRVISRSRRLRLITLTDTLIIVDITKTVVLLYIQRKKIMLLSPMLFT